ncbi:MAG: chitobiase/beta-hexosaminidase C-terminal domain-containing protein, partial [Oscillospiraceae bacterium]
GSAVYGQGRLRFTLNGFDSEKKDISATIKVALPTQNYKDIKFSVIVSITAKLDKDAPAASEFELSVDLQSGNTYTATIVTALAGVEYSFDGTTWSNTNTKAVNHAETVTGYIRYAETDDYNASPYSSKTETTAHGTLTHHAAKAATCTEDGNIEYWTCDICKLYFSDENGKTEITQAQTVIAKQGHKWADTYNFDKDGHWHECEVCGDTTEKEPHISGGAATEDSAEICTVCGYEISPKLGQVAAPLFAPHGGTFTEAQTVTITTATEGAVIYYTTDGTKPTASSTKYTGALTISKTTTIKAIAVKDGMKNSAIVTAEFTINLPVKETVATPVISPNGGTFSGSQKVTITCETAGVKIYYTTDGSAPTMSSKLYTGAFTISATTTVKAIAVKDGMVDSEVATATFTKKSSGGGGGYRPTTPSEPKQPSIDGNEQSWSEVEAYLATLPIGSEVAIELNGNTTVPVEVIKVIDERDLKVTFVVDSVNSWKTDGAKITTPAAADLTFTKTASINLGGLCGTEGIQFTMNNTNIPTDLEITFRTAHAGKFANLYKNVSGKPVFVTCAKLDADGKVLLPD